MTLQEIIRAEVEHAYATTRAVLDRAVNMADSREVPVRYTVGELKTIAAALGAIHYKALRAENPAAPTVEG